MDIMPWKVPRPLCVRRQVSSIPNPRVEAEEHYYNAKHSKMEDLGLQPHLLADNMVDSLISFVLEVRQTPTHLCLEGWTVKYASAGICVAQVELRCRII